MIQQMLAIDLLASLKSISIKLSRKKVQGLHVSDILFEIKNSITTMMEEYILDNIQFQIHTSIQQN